MTVRVHGPMRRKGDGKPYLVHPIAVLSLLVKWEANEDTCIAGLLHDVIEDAGEDQKRTEYRKEILEKFGKNILEVVEGVTEQDKSLPWKKRKDLYLEHMKIASRESLLVSCADRTHNVQSLIESYVLKGEKIWSHFNAPKQEQMWFLGEVLRTLEERLDNRYIEELRANVEHLNELIC
ncbi:MAG: HD domain-containing protein [Candidatus Peribacteraceae bacterium]|nr:HD domain-containing protein [Candidatus Peribacteraceae bacterium]